MKHRVFKKHVCACKRFFRHNCSIKNVKTFYDFRILNAHTNPPGGLSVSATNREIENERSTHLFGGFGYAKNMHKTRINIVVKYQSRNTKTNLS